MRVTRRPCARDEEVRQVEQRKVDRFEQAFEVHGPGAPERDREAGTVEDHRGAGAGARFQDRVRVGLAQRFERGFVGVGEQLGQHPVHDDRSERDRQFGAQPSDELDGFRHRHLFGRRDDVDRRYRGILEHLAEPLRLRAHGTDVHELTDPGRRAELGDDVSGRGRVDDDEVDVGAALDRLPHLPTDLADRQDLLHAGCCTRNEVERFGEGSDAAEHRHPQVELEVLLQRRFGVHRHGEDAGMHFARREPDRPLLELCGDVALRVDLDQQDTLADVRREQRRRGGNRALADATLACEEEETPVEQIGCGPYHHAGGGRPVLPGAEADLAIPGITRDLDEGDLVGRDADALALLVGQPQRARAAAQRVVDGLGDLLR